MLNKHTIFHFGREKSAFLLCEKRVIFVAPAENIEAAQEKSDVNQRASLINDVEKDKTAADVQASTKALQGKITVPASIDSAKEVIDNQEIFSDIRKNETYRKGFTANNFDTQKKEIKGPLAKALEGEDPTELQKMYKEELVKIQEKKKTDLEEDLLKKKNDWKIACSNLEKIDFDKNVGVNKITSTTILEGVNLSPFWYGDNKPFPNILFISIAIGKLKVAKDEESKKPGKDQIKINKLSAVINLLENKVSPGNLTQEKKGDFDLVFSSSTQEIDTKIAEKNAEKMIITNKEESQKTTDEKIKEKLLEADIAILEAIKLSKEADNTKVFNIATLSNVINSTKLLIENAKKSLKTKDKNSADYQASEILINNLEDQINYLEDFLALSIAQKNNDPKTAAYYAVINRKDEVKDWIGEAKLDEFLDKVAEDADKTLFDNQTERLQRPTNNNAAKEFMTFLVLTKGVDANDLRKNLATIPLENVQAFYNSITEKILKPENPITFPVLSNDVSNFLTNNFSEVNCKEFQKLFLEAEKEQRDELRKDVDKASFLDKKEQEKRFKETYKIDITQTAKNYVNMEIGKTNDNIDLWFDASGKKVISSFTKEDWIVGSLKDDLTTKEDCNTVGLLSNASDLNYLRTYIAKYKGQREQEQLTMAKIENMEDAPDYIDQGIGGIIDMVTSGDPKDMATAGILLFVAFKALFGDGKTSKYLKYAIAGLAATKFAKDKFGFDVFEQLNLKSIESAFVGTKFQAQLDMFDFYRESLNPEGYFEELAIDADKNERATIMAAMNDTPISELIDWEETPRTESKIENSSSVIQENMPNNLKEAIEDMSKDDNDKQKKSGIALGLLYLFYKDISYRQTGSSNITKGKDILIAKYLDNDKNNKKILGEVLDEKITNSELEFSKGQSRDIIDSLLQDYENIKKEYSPYLENIFKQGKEKAVFFIGSLWHIWGPKTLDFVKEVSAKGWKFGENCTDKVFEFVNESGAIEVGKDLLKVVYAAVGIPAKGLWELVKFTADLGKKESLEKGVKYTEAQIKIFWQEWLGISNLDTVLQNEQNSADWQKINNDSIWKDNYFGQYADEVATAMFSSNNTHFDKNTYFSTGKVEMNPNEFKDDPTQTDASMKLIWQKRALEQAKETLKQNIQQGNQPFAKWEEKLDDCIITSFKQNENGTPYLYAALRVPTQKESEPTREMKTFDYVWEKEWKKFGEKKVNIIEDIEANNGDTIKGNMTINRFFNFLDTHSIEYLLTIDKNPEQDFQDFSTSKDYYAKNIIVNHAQDEFFDGAQKLIEDLFKDSFKHVDYLEKENEEIKITL